MERNPALGQGGGAGWIEKKQCVKTEGGASMIRLGRGMGADLKE